MQILEGNSLGVSVTWCYGRGLKPKNAFEARLLMEKGFHRGVCVCYQMLPLLFYTHQHPVCFFQCMRRVGEVKRLEIWFRGNREKQALCTTKWLPDDES